MKTVPDSRSKNAKCSGAKIGAKTERMTLSDDDECTRTHTAVEERTEIFRLTSAKSIRSYHGDLVSDALFDR